MFEVVLVGDAQLAAEVVSIQGGTVSAQVYEYTGGIRVGDPARRHGRAARRPPRSRVIRLDPGRIASIARR